METKFPNKAKVKKITFNYTEHCYCPMSKERYKAEIHVEINEPKFLFDYLEGKRFIKSLSGKTLIIEDLARTVHDWFTDCVDDDEDVIVKVNAESPTLFPVTVEV